LTAAVSLATALFLATSLFHFATFRWLSGGMSRITMSASIRMLVILLAIVVAHLAEIAGYAVAYAVAAEYLEIGAFGGIPIREPLDYLYFSTVSYTSLGLGDAFPGGHLRFIAGIEALNGLLLITWSGSFIYLAMRRLWPWQPCAEPNSEDVGETHLSRE